MGLASALSSLLLPFLLPQHPAHPCSAFLFSQGLFIPLEQTGSRQLESPPAN